MTRAEKEALCQQIFKLHGYCKRRWNGKQQKFLHVGECKLERIIKDMGGFTKLRDDFDQWFKALDPLVSQGKGTTEKQQQDVFRYLYLRCLFEIAGNLDTIALCARACMEQLEKSRIENKERFETMFNDQFKEVFESLKKPLTFSFPEDPRRTIPVPEAPHPKVKKKH